MTTMTVLVIIGLLATATALVLGIASMVQGGDFNQRRGHWFMFARVGLQGVTLVVLLIALLLTTR